MIERLLSKPKDYTFDEAKTLLNRLGYELYTKGSTSGSRVKFYRESDQAKILLHRPHNPELFKSYMINDLIQNLRERGDLDE